MNRLLVIFVLVVLLAWPQSAAAADKPVLFTGVTMIGVGTALTLYAGTTFKTRHSFYPDEWNKPLLAAGIGLLTGGGILAVIGGAAERYPQIGLGPNGIVITKSIRF